MNHTTMLRKVFEAHRALGPEVRKTPVHEMMQALDELEALERLGPGTIAAKNPAAFPVIGTTETATHTVHIAQEGITLRDWFAGQFMAARLAHPTVSEHWTDDDMTRAAYQRADAMLKARGATDASSPTCAPWNENVWPKPPEYDADIWAAHIAPSRRRVWVMMWNGGAMAEVGEPSDAELRRYVGEVMAGGPGFASAKKEGT